MKSKFLITLFIVFGLTGIFLACKKDQQNNNTAYENNSQGGKTVGKFPFPRIFKVEIHRYKGVNRKYEPCDCNSCAGFCDFEWFPDFKASSVANANFALVNNNDGSGRIYFFVPIDVETDGIFYIDNDVVVNDAEEQFKILKNEYPLNITSGTLVVGEEIASYNSYIDVNVVNLD